MRIPYDGMLKSYATTIELLIQVDHNIVTTIGESQRPTFHGSIPL